MNEALIRIENVTKSFGGFEALHGIDIEIGRGEFFSLLGASGCGKTTLLRILAGIESPSTGRVLIDGQDMSGVPPERRPTNMVFQSYAIFPHLNVVENVGYGLRNLKIGRTEAKARIESSIELVKLNGLEDRNSHTLSGGQRQRVALARALAMQPKVLLLDEPLSALDKKLREEMQLELRAMQRRLGITFVFATHDQEEAMTLSDRIAMMSAGKIIQLDTPKRLYERPATREVAEFIGAMNLFPARIVGVGKQTLTLDGSLFNGLSAPKPETDSAPGTEVHLAVRPERIVLQAANSQTPHQISARVAEAVYLGDRINYLLDVKGMDRQILATSAQSNDDMHKIGSEVAVSWPEEAGRVLVS